MVGCSCLISCGRISSGVSTVDRFFDRNGGAIEQEKKGKMKKTKNKKQKKKQVSRAVMAGNCDASAALFGGGLVVCVAPVVPSCSIRAGTSSNINVSQATVPRVARSHTPASLPSFYLRALPSFPGCPCVFIGFTGFYWVLLGFTEFYWVLLGFTESYWVLLSFTGFYWVLLGFTRLNSAEQNLLGLKEFQWGLLGLT